VYARMETCNAVPPDNQYQRPLAAVRRRAGYRRLGILLARAAITMNERKLLWLLREEPGGCVAGADVRARRGRVCSL